MQKLLAQFWLQGRDLCSAPNHPHGIYLLLSLWEPSCTAQPRAGILFHK